NYTVQGASARNARARLNIGVHLASFEKEGDGSTLDELAAAGGMIAGVLVGTKDQCAAERNVKLLSAINNSRQ
ncbi:MAG: hypothetical protein WBQ55_21650, partial [Xanthobacteraceae bacterium]